jgi:hypothetical protein
LIARPLVLPGERSSFFVLTLKPPVSAWNWIQLAAGARPTNTIWFSSRWKRMPSPMTWPS